MLGKIRGRVMDPVLIPRRRANPRWVWSCGKHADYSLGGVLIEMDVICWAFPDRDGALDGYDGEKIGCVGGSC